MKKNIAIPVTLSLMVFCFGTVWAEPPSSRSAPVTVVNTSANPVPVDASVTGSVSISGTVPVMNVNNPDKENIYWEQLDVVLRGVAENEVYGTPVPLGRRLIIEHVSATARMPSGQALVNLQIGGMTSLAQSTYLFAAFQGSSSDGINHFIASQPIKLRVDSGNVVTCRVTRSASGLVADATVTLYLLGYWIEYP